MLSHIAEQPTTPQPFGWHIARYTGDKLEQQDVQYTPPEPEILKNLGHHHRVVVTELRAGPQPDVLEILTKARPHLVQAGEIVGYGFHRPANPNNFCPDAESCSDDEIAAHKAACEAFNKGEYTPERGSEWVGKMHILRAPWGIGSYSETDPEIALLLAEIDAALAAKQVPK